MTPIDKTFWEEKHNDNDNWWLTGTTIDNLLFYHNLTPKDLYNKTILEIGVGLGTCTTNLNKLCKELFCCDVAESALERVKECSSKQFISSDINLIPPVDVAICHLVFQHCTDLEIERIINDVNLIEDGVFSFQFAALENNIMTSSMQTLVNNGELFFRDLEIVKEIVQRSNKEIFYISPPKWWGGKNKHNWFIIKLRNKK